MTELEKLKKHTNYFGEYTKISEYEKGNLDGWNACIDHLAAQGKILRDGWQAVPKEPTIEMTNKVVRYFTCQSKNLATDAYKAMLAAAPKPFEGGGK